MPQEDWQEILDALRYAVEKSDALRSGEVASEVMSLPPIIDGIMEGSLEFFKNSRLTSIIQYAFMQHTNLKSVVLPNVTSLKQNTFRQCTQLERVDFSSLTSIEMYAFHGASAVKTLIIRTNAVCTLVNTMAFLGTPIWDVAGYIYVPASLVDEYKQATNWTKFADVIRAIEDYPEITGETI
jgi:hypothetical protein